MSPLLPNAGPPLPQTHTPVDPSELFRLRNAILATHPDGKVSHEALQAIAKTEDVPASHVYASSALDPNIILPIEAETLFVVCTGACQAQGALENLDAFIASRNTREGLGKKLFDILPRNCLDMCPHSPVTISRSTLGQVAHPKLKAADIGEIVEQLCDAAEA